MDLVIQGFDATALADPGQVRGAAAVVADRVRNGDQVVVTVPALGHDIDALLYAAMAEVGIESESLSEIEAGIVTDAERVNAQIVGIHPRRLRAALEAGIVPVVSASDTIAIALTVLLDASGCEIFTDVEAIFSADPRVLPVAHRLEQLSFTQLALMQEAGYPKPASLAIGYAERHGVTIALRALGAAHGGTLIAPKLDDGADGPFAVVNKRDAREDHCIVSVISGGDHGATVIEVANVLLDEEIRPISITAGAAVTRATVPATSGVAAARALHAALLPLPQIALY